MKKRGYYCYGCCDFLPDERFSGGGHRLHLYKDFKKEGNTPYQRSISGYDRKYHNLKKAVRNCLIVFIEEESFFN